MDLNTSVKKPDTTNNHLANERTFLAWIRSSISIIVFGFVVAKFGIALREFFYVQGHHVKGSNDSLYIGIAFMAFGTLIALTSLFRYQITMRRIDAYDFKPAKMIVIILGVFGTLFGAILIAYLIFASQSV